METQVVNGGAKSVELSGYEKRLEKASAVPIKKIECQKVVEGYRRAKAAFDVFHSAFSSNAANDPLWHPDVKTLKKMHKHLDTMKIFHMYAQKKEGFNRGKCCNHEKSWWLSKVSTVSNIVVDVAAALTVVGESFYQEALEYFNVTLEEGDHLPAVNMTTALPVTSLSYWGIAAVSTSVLFSKIRVFAQTKVVKAEAELALLSKVLGDSKLVIQEYKNKLILWEKTASLFRSHRRTIGRDFLAVKKRYKRISKERERELHDYVKKVLCELYKRSTGRQIKLKPHRAISDTSETSPGVVQEAEGRGCCQKKDPFNLTMEDLIDCNNKITFAREFVAVAIEEINNQVSAIKRSDYDQSRRVIEEQIIVLKELFDQLGLIPAWVFTSPVMHNIFRGIGLVGVEVTSLTTTSIKEYQDEIGEGDTTMKIVAIVLFIFCGIFSAMSSCIHKKEMTRIKLGAEVTRLNGLRWILKDLGSIGVILQTHERWRNQSDVESRKMAFNDHLMALEKTKGKVLGLKVRNMLKKLKKSPDSLASKEEVVQTIRIHSAHSTNEEFDALKCLEGYVLAKTQEGRVVCAEELENVLIAWVAEKSPDAIRSQKSVSEMREYALKRVEEDASSFDEESPIDKKIKRRFVWTNAREADSETDSSYDTGSESAFSEIELSEFETEEE